MPLGTGTQAPEQIFVRMAQGGVISVDNLSLSSATVRDLKAAIERKSGMAASEMRLAFQSKPLPESRELRVSSQELELQVAGSVVALRHSRSPCSELPWHGRVVAVLESGESAGVRSIGQEAIAGRESA